MIENKTIAIEYEPPTWISAAECGLLIDWKADTNDLTCLIYEWYIKWYIDINFTWDNRFLVNIKKFIWQIHAKVIHISEKKFFNPKKEYEKNFLKLIKYENIIDNKFYEQCNELLNYWIKEWRFTKTSIIKNKIKKILKEIFFKDVKKYKYTLKSQVNITMEIISIILTIIFRHELSIYFQNYNFLIIFSILILSIFSIINKIQIRFKNLWWCSEYKYKLSKKWKELQQKILWYKEYLEKVEKYRLNLYLKGNKMYYEKIMPYIVAFGIIPKTEILNDIIKDYNLKINID